MTRDLPELSLSRVVRGALTTAVNHALRGEPWARQRLAVHAGKIVALEVVPLSLNWLVMEDGCLGTALDPVAADVTLAMSAGTLPLIVSGAWAGDGLQAAAMRQVRIVGDAELAHLLSALFQHLRWDVEEDLSRFVGDMTAHRLVNAAKAAAGQVRRVRDGLAANITEYLVEERPTLVTGQYLSEHARALRALAEDLAGLERRIARLG